MSKVTTPDGHSIEVVESYDPNGDPILKIQDLSSMDQKKAWGVHVKLSQQNLVDLMYEFAKAKIRNEERG